MFIATLLLTGMIIPPSASSRTKLHSLPPSYQMSDSRCHLVGEFVYTVMAVTAVRLLFWCNIHIDWSSDSWRLDAIVLLSDCSGFGCGSQSEDIKSSCSQTSWFRGPVTNSLILWTPSPKLCPLADPSITPRWSISSSNKYTEEKYLNSRNFIMSV
jgi:hypothetical protein